MATAYLNLKQLNKRVRSNQAFKVLVNALIEEGLLDKPSLTFEKIKDDKDVFFQFIAKVFSSRTDEQKESVIHSVLFCKKFRKPDIEAFAQKTEEITKKYLVKKDRKEHKKGLFLQSIVKAISGTTLNPDDIEEVDLEDEN